MSPAARAGYAKELKGLKSVLEELGRDIPNTEAVDKTITCIDGTLQDIASLT